MDLCQLERQGHPGCLQLFQCYDLRSHRVDEIRAIVDAVIHERRMRGSREEGFVVTAFRYRQQVKLECSEAFSLP